MKKIFCDITPEEIDKKASEILNWTEKTAMLDVWVREQLADIIQYGGKKITLITSNDKKISGILTGVNLYYIELDKMKKIAIEDIDSIIIK